MVVAAHQAQFLPYLGFFNKMKNCDMFVLLDDVQFVKNEWHNRNRIRTKYGWQWLTVPVIHNFGQLIKDVKINNKTKWRHKHLQAFITNYSKAKHFEDYIGFLKETYEKEWTKLIDINLHFIFFIANELEIKTPIVFSSELGIKPTRTQRLIDICKKLGADTYLSGGGGYYYLVFSLFRQARIRLKFQNYVYPRYTQQYEGFVPYLSAIDLILNYGKEGCKFI